MPTPLTHEQTSIINDAFNKITDLMIQLYSRWLEESKYEDISEYQKVIERHVTDRIKVVGMSKRPFGFKFTIDDNDGVFGMFIKSNQFSWKRI